MADTQTGLNSSSEPQLYGLLAEFDQVETLREAAGQVRQSGYTRWEVYSPFPVHGMDRAMGARPTRLPWIVLLMGLTGLSGALLLQWWTNGVNYPFIISGKPFFSLPANIPIIFELTVLLSAFGAFFGMLILNRLPRLFHPLFKNRRFQRVGIDRFFIVIEADDPKFDRARVAQWLRSLGACAVEEVEE